MNRSKWNFKSNTGQDTSGLIVINKKEFSFNKKKEGTNKLQFSDTITSGL